MQKKTQTKFTHTRLEYMQVPTSTFLCSVMPKPAFEICSPKMMRSTRLAPSSTDSYSMCLRCTTMTAGAVSSCTSLANTRTEMCGRIELCEVAYTTCINTKRPLLSFKLSPAHIVCEAVSRLMYSTSVM